MCCLGWMRLCKHMVKVWISVMFFSWLSYMTRSPGPSFFIAAIFSTVVLWVLPSAIAREHESSLQLAEIRRIQNLYPRATLK